MQLRTPARGYARRFIERVAHRSLRLQVFRFAARLLPSRLRGLGLLRLASWLSEAGRTREALLCWRVLHRVAPADTRIVMARISCAIAMGDVAEVERALADSAKGAGIPPHCLVRFAGQLAQHGHPRGAGAMLALLCRLVDTRRLVEQTPSIVSAKLPTDLGSFGRILASGDYEVAKHSLPLARLCFAFRSPEVAAPLFATAEAIEPLEATDRAAMLHSFAESDHGARQMPRAELGKLLERLSDDPNALGMLAKVALIAGEVDIAHDAVALSLQAHYGRLSKTELVADDCHAILKALAALHSMEAELPPMLLERAPATAPGIPKVFLCGFGWSGSGAVYDEIRSTRGYCEFEGAGRDPIINEDADSEVTFVQGPGGLGELWRSAQEQGRISWQSLWDTFNLHTVGLSSTGYSEYKCAAAARNHVRHYGTGYTGPFRRFLEGYARLRLDPRPGALHASLLDTTESLCSMLIQQKGERAVLFNNALFGRDALMLEIFRSRRAVIVYRDPRDVYIDRRSNDRNHWRTPAQQAAFYGHGLRRYKEHRTGRGASDPGLREVPFERFVKDDRFRAAVRDWLLGEHADAPAARHFDPAASSRNIGIHAGLLTPTEQAQLRLALVECRALDTLSEAVWTTDRRKH